MYVYIYIYVHLCYTYRLSPLVPACTAPTALRATAAVGRCTPENLGWAQKWPHHIISFHIASHHTILYHYIHITAGQRADPGQAREARVSAEVSFGRGDLSVCPLGVSTGAHGCPIFVWRRVPQASPQGRTLRALLLRGTSVLHWHCHTRPGDWNPCNCNHTLFQHLIRAMPRFMIWCYDMIRYEHL